MYLSIPIDRKDVLAKLWEKTSCYKRLKANRFFFSKRCLFLGIMVFSKKDKTPVFWFVQAVVRTIRSEAAALGESLPPPRTINS